jgi:hypothetical protein
MQQRIAKFGVGFMVVSAVIIALYSLRFYGVPFGHWALMDPRMRDLITAIPFKALSAWLAYTSWIPNVIAVGVYWAFERARKRSRALAANLHGIVLSQP